MSNYNQNPPYFPSHASLPSFPSQTVSNGQQPAQNFQQELQIPGSYNIQDPTQQIFEQLPGVLDPSLRPFETTAQQPIQNMQIQDPMLSSQPGQNQNQSQFDLIDDIPTPLEPNLQPNIVNNSIALRDYHQPMLPPLPDILTPLETFQNQHLSSETLSHPTDPQAAQSSQLLENHMFPQSTIRRSLSKPSMATKRRSKQPIRSKKAAHNPSAPPLKRSISHQPRSVRPKQPSRESINYRAPKAPPNGLPNVIQDQSFKASLRSVLSRSNKPFNSSNLHRTQSTLQPRFPDRPECGANTIPVVKHPSRDQAGSSSMHAMEMSRDMRNGGLVPATGLISQGSIPVNRSIPHLDRVSSQKNTNPPSLTIRKRPASCSSLPSRKSSKDFGKSKRPCDSVDQAVAEGRELTKEEIRVLRNRQHAFNSRQRTKAKKKQFHEENAILRERISQLESENEQLRSMRNSLLEMAPVQLRLQMQMRDNPDSEAITSGCHNEEEQTEADSTQTIKEGERSP